MLTQERLKEVFKYNPVTGLFTRLIATARRNKVGEEAGCLSDGGYIMIGLDSKKYRAHRLAFLYMRGYLPENQIDHKDQVRCNNKWSNLREASQSCQSRNCCTSSNNVSGVKGVCPLKGKWRANIYYNKKQNHLGVYDDFVDAVCARLFAEQCLGWGDCDITSPAYKYMEVS